MTMETVDWSAWRTRPGGQPMAEGLRERKKRLLRRQLSDTATRMFLERGFDAVRVSEIAQACEVSEKTVFNYFPTKESLVLDLEESTMDALRSRLADPRTPPVKAALAILAEDLAAVTSWLTAQADPAQAAGMFRRFGAMLRSTPSLRAHQHDMTDRLTAAAAQTLAKRVGMSPHDPEPQAAAAALIGLWPIQFRSLARHLDGTLTPDQIQAVVTADVKRAARLIDHGLRTFKPPTKT